MKGLSWLRPDGARIDIKLRADGLYEGRQDLSTDGTKIVTKYDDEGEVASRWRILRNGHTVRL